MATTIFEVITIIETQQTEIERARAVYEEANQYFQTTDPVKLSWLPRHAGHILNLLDAADHFLWQALPELQKAVDGLLELHKASKAGGGGN